MTTRFPSRASWALRLLALLALALTGFSACALPKGDQEHISGTIQARHIVDAKSGKAEISGIAASITCGDGSAHSSATGAYQLSASVESLYSCSISAPGYSTLKVKVPGSAQASMVVNFAADWAGACSITARAGAVTCPGLQPPPGTLSGTVTSSDADTVAKGVNVTCWDTNPALQTDGQMPKPFTTQTDQLGHYSLSLPADSYGCVANEDAQLYTVTVAPAARVSANFDICDPHCPSFDFHDGHVLHSLTAYLIFWLPKGHTFEPGGSDKRFESLMARYFKDLSGTSFYNILTQYWDHQGPISPSVSVGGTYLNTAAYPHAGTRSDPLSGSDIEAEISRVVAAKKWPGSGDAVYFLFTGYDVQACTRLGRGPSCTYYTNDNAFCGYHSSYPGTQGMRYYAYISDSADCAQLPTTGEYPSPTSDAIADAELSIVSHEQFEAVSDPLADGWYDHVPDTGEMADKCEEEFGNIGPDGANVTLAHGHRYIVQAEWSLAAGGCAFSYTPQG